MTIEILSKTCPRCGAKMPINLGFITWCDQCGYNLDNSIEFDADKPKGMFPRLWTWMGKQSGERLFKKACQMTNLRPEVSFSIVLAWLVALIVNGFTLLLFSIPVIWLVWTIRDWGHVVGYIIFFRIIGSVALLFMVWKIRPHLGKMNQNAVRREQSSSSGLEPLFTLADKLSDALGAPRVNAILITPDFNAGIGQVGWKRERVLRLGLPLLITLDRQELVALLGHEMAHNVNGDPQRTWLISGAIHSLFEWSNMFYIDRIPLIRGIAGSLNLLIHLVMFLLSLFSWLGAWLLGVLLYPTMQRAEYKADILSARLAGTDSVLNMMRKLYLRQSVQNIYQKAHFYAETRIMQEIHERMCNVPDREWLRIERLIERGESRLEDTHPTTKNRLAFLRSRPKEMGQVALSMAEYGQVMEGLKGFEDRVERQIRMTMARKN